MSSAGTVDNIYIRALDDELKSIFLTEFDPKKTAAITTYE